MRTLQLTKPHRWGMPLARAGEDKVVVNCTTSHFLHKAIICNIWNGYFYAPLSPLSIATPKHEMLACCLLLVVS